VLLVYITMPYYVHMLYGVKESVTVNHELHARGTNGNSHGFGRDTLRKEYRVQDIGVDGRVVLKWSRDGGREGVD